MNSTIKTGEIKVSEFVHRDEPVRNAIAILYSLLSYGSGIALILHNNGWFNAAGVLILTHGLIISAYLSHEFMHGTIFRSRRLNEVGGTIMLWLTGACYAKFSDLAKLHIAHHVDRVDFCRFDLIEYLNALPKLLRWTIMGLEWLYFPALALILRIRTIFAPFWTEERKDERIKSIAILTVRAAFFSGLAVISIKALLLYFVAYINLINILRFVDAFQHTYEVFPFGAELPKRDRAQEQANTFSNVISLKSPWLNVLMLNFGYHNAHHELMKCPWHSLPALDSALFTGEEVHYITLPELAYNYHRFRLKRLFSGQGIAIDEKGDRCLETFYGGSEVSFLVMPG
jgi:fatty acid desaturase